MLSNDNMHYSVGVLIMPVWIDYLVQRFWFTTRGGYCIDLLVVILDQPSWGAVAMWSSLWLSLPRRMWSGLPFTPSSLPLIYGTTDAWVLYVSYPG